MMKLNIEAPWYTFNKQVMALFENDPDVEVGEIMETDRAKEGVDYIIPINVRKHAKFLALDRVAAKTKTFGKITVGIVLFDMENADVNSNQMTELYRTLFEGNGAVEKIEEVVDFAGTPYCYVCFKPEVVQFLDDNTADIDGKWNGLAQDIAKEFFASKFGVFFCTAAK